MTTIFRVAAIMAAVAIAMGAFAAHGLVDTLTDQALGWIETASHYLLIHAVAIIALQQASADNKAQRLAIIGLSIGTGIFSVSLYLMALFNWRFMGIFTPIGGILMIGSWLLIAFCNWRRH